MKKKYGLRFILLHHSNAKQDAAGNSDIEAQCLTDLSLAGKKSLKAETKRLRQDSLPSPLAEYFDTPGCLFKATFTKCRAYPELDDTALGPFCLIMRVRRPKIPDGKRSRLNPYLTEWVLLQPQVRRRRVRLRNYPPTKKSSWSWPKAWRPSSVPMWIAVCTMGGRRTRSSSAIL